MNNIGKGSSTREDEKKYQNWLKDQDDFSGGDKAYKYIDSNGLVYRLVAMGAPEKRTDSKYFIPLNHPITNLPCPIPPNGWSRTPDTIQELLQSNMVVFGKDHTTQPQKKVYLNEDGKKQIVSIYDEAKSGKVFLDPLGIKFPYSHPVSMYEYLTTIFDENSITIDYFAGSGTTAHAVINLNRQDKGNRQYILVEQGEYFDTVLKPRVQKVIYSQEWKDGKPIASDKNSGSLNGVPQIVKVLKLESYEDTLNNLELRRSDLFEKLPKPAQHDYLLHYMLNIESRDSLLNVSHFAKPFDYGLNISTTSAGAYAWQKVDLVETFNYLIGAKVISVDDKRSEQGFVAVECRLPNQHADEKTLIFWRDCERIGYDELRKYFAEHLRITPADSEYSQVYVNGDHTLETVWDGEHSGSLKIRSIEAEFLALMFAGEE